MDTILSTAAVGPSLPLALDHLVVAARTLEEGEAWLQARLGCRLTPGGAHTGFGTHNRLLKLGDSCYLELIAPDPAQTRTDGLLFGLDTEPVAHAMRAAPVLLHTVFRILKPAVMADVLPRLRYDPGIPTAMSRGDLRWMITIPAGRRPAGRGLLPTIIDWGETSHPCSRLPHQAIELAAIHYLGPPAVMARFPRVEPTDPSVSGPAVDLGIDEGRQAAAPADEPAARLAPGAESGYTIRADFQVAGRLATIESRLPP